MFKTLLIRIARELTGAGLSYMIIGGQAVLLYGTPRLTRDIDVTLGVSVDEMERVLNAVGAMGLEIIPTDVGAFVERTFVLPAKDSSTGIRVDLIFSFTPYERQAIERARPIFFDDTAVMFASLEDVIIHKIFAGRPRDLEDAAAILVKNPDFDRDYIQKWLKELDRSMETNEFSSRFAEVRGQTG
jgi:hypothetical protein